MCVRYRTCRLWKLNLTQSQLNDSYQFPWDLDQVFMLKEARLTALATIILFIHTTHREYRQGHVILTYSESPDRGPQYFIRKTTLAGEKEIFSV